MVWNLTKPETKIENPEILIFNLGNKLYYHVQKISQDSEIICYQTCPCTFLCPEYDKGKHVSRPVFNFIRHDIKKNLWSYSNKKDEIWIARFC